MVGLAGLHLLLRNQPPPGVTQAVIVSDTALALWQLWRLQPDWCHSIILTWQRMVSEYLTYYPHMHILVMWGPSKETPSLATVDQLAKQARTRGRSPTCSLRVAVMAQWEITCDPLVKSQSERPRFKPRSWHNRAQEARP